MKIWVCFFMVCAMPSLASIQAPLFPEDGSQRINSWFYSKYEVSKNYREAGSFALVKQAFAKHGVKTVGLDKKIAWLQDILFFDQNGNHLVLKDPGYGEEFYQGLTGAVYTYEGPGYFDLQKFAAEDMPFEYVKSIPLKYSLFEGGGLISGKFKNSESYAIVTHERFHSVKRYIEYQLEKEISLTEAKEIVAKDFQLLGRNLFVLPAKVSGRHLDLYLKALPDGVLLVDQSEEAKQEYLEELYVKTRDQSLLNFLEYYRNERDYFYTYGLPAAIDFLSKNFEIHRVFGEFREITHRNGFARTEKNVNFFNGISGVDPEGKSFFITNRSASSKLLEKQFSSSLRAFGFEDENVHFVGRYYLGAAGIDCFGVPSPVRIN
ncbi:MAG: hypothetical protein VX642_03870 [Bdellovibrionota bacterium]|nr:hypothetical protein [Bdellovibrionota bacterium]